MPCIGTIIVEEVRQCLEGAAGILPPELFCDPSAGKMPAAPWGLCFRAFRAVTRHHPFAQNLVRRFHGVQVNGEFVGVLFRDEEDGEISYAFNMAILEMDLPEAPASRT